MLKFSAVSFSESVVELIVENKMEGCFLPVKCRKLVGSKAKKNWLFSPPNLLKE